MLAALTVPIALAHPASAEMQAIDQSKSGRPPDIASFIGRQVGCRHWSGESAVDAERAAQIKKALRELKCRALAGDERRLRIRYAKSPNALRALDQADDLISY
jgi:hypothetical protein